MRIKIIIIILGLLLCTSSPFYSRTLLVMWLACDLCFHFLCIRIRMKNISLVSFLNYNLCLTHFVTWKVGTECGQISDKRRHPEPGTVRPLKQVTEWSVCSHLGLDGERPHCDLPRPDVMASLALAFSQNSGLKERVCLSTLGVISYSKTGSAGQRGDVHFLKYFICGC